MNQQNNLDWKKYELITKYIYETLGHEFNIHVEDNGKDCKVLGASGVYHQIDVLTSETNGINTYRTAVECKYWNKKINKDIVMKLWAIVHDAQLSRGIIVSKNGFTPDAQRFADYYNIKLVVLKETTKEDNSEENEVELAEIKLFVNTKLKRPLIKKVTIETADNREIVVSEKRQYQITIENLNGQKIRLSDTIMVFEKYLHQQNSFHCITKSYDYPDHTLYLDDKSFKIKKNKPQRTINCYK